LLQGKPSGDPKAALAFVSVRLHDLDAAVLGLFANRGSLVVSRVLLVLGRHPHVLSRAERRLAALRQRRFASFHAAAPQRACGFPPPGDRRSEGLIPASRTADTTLPALLVAGDEVLSLQSDVVRENS
jgi:hypothetical protein